MAGSHNRYLPAARSGFAFVAVIKRIVMHRPMAFGWAERRTDATQPEFWFAMQFTMLASFCTSYPVNWLLVRSGIKEAM